MGRAWLSVAAAAVCALAGPVAASGPGQTQQDVIHYEPAEYYAKFFAAADWARAAPPAPDWFASRLEPERDSRWRSTLESGPYADYISLLEMPDFRFLEDRTGAEASARAKAGSEERRAGAESKARTGTREGDKPGNFPDQEWTYNNVDSPPEWLVPKKQEPPGLPLTKPPPVPEMIPPPPPFPAYLDNHGPYSGAGSESPPPPTYSLPRPPPNILPRWIPWSAYYVSNPKGGGVE